jgi:hypothetical protein
MPNSIVAITSIPWGRFLQAHTDGEMHASNDSRGSEETWILTDVDAPHGIYSLRNYRTGRYLSSDPIGQAWANRVALGPWENWQLRRNAAGEVSFQSILRPDCEWYLCTLAPGNDTAGGGEVHTSSALQTWNIHNVPPPADCSILGCIGDLIDVASVVASLAGI